MQEEGSPAELASEQMSQAPEAVPRGRQPEECAEVAGQEASHLREQLEAADRRQKEMWQQVSRECGCGAFAEYWVHR